MLKSSAIGVYRGLRGVVSQIRMRRSFLLQCEGMVRRSVKFINVQAGVTGEPQPSADRKLTERLVAAYRLAHAEEHATGDSMWTMFFERKLGDIHRTFLSGDLEASVQVLRYPARSNHFYGFDGMALDLQPVVGSARWRKGNAIGVADGLARVAEAIGARRYPYAEVVSTAAALRPVVDPEDCIREIDAALGFHFLVPMPFPEEHGLQTRRGIISYRVPQAIYQAWRIRELTWGIENPRVLEIGGGLGRTAFYARQMGITDYTIVDLPLTSLAQGSFLGRVLGDDAVVLAGEDVADRTGDPQRIKLIPPEQFLAADTTYDLIVNVDSLTEMSREVATRYVDAALKRAGVFLSINHEHNAFTVRELLGQRSLKRPPSRMPYPMRDGYLDEVVDLRR